ncbi:MAG TPA: GNAT family N-acetyltransferase [Bacteroidales bacterium]|nr:GNAT family N-acetyltransferase [Bacteroidales bacterium]
MKDRIIIRPIKETEFGFLGKMLYNAIFVPPGHERLPENIIEHPEISKYIKDFGREGDLCFVAEADGELTGAVWSRLFDETNKAYGFVDSDTPELSMAVYEKYRRKGIGTLLLKTIIKALTEEGYGQISLSVDKINYAYDLYKKIGFKDYKPVDDSMTMIMKLK